MKIACVADYLPRVCGIATFTHDVVNAVAGNGFESYIVALNDPDKKYEYPDIVQYEVRQEHQRDYLQAARFINLSGADVCLLQHEYGIYGGDSGIYVLNLIWRLEKPLVVTLHTILKDPTSDQRVILKEISQKAQKLVVMSQMASGFLSNIYGVDRGKIAVIEHGVPDLAARDRIEEKKKHGLENRKSILTFGLIGRSKGIETVIEALPKIVEKHPEVLYIVLGRTHPHVAARMGEEYRNYLQLLVDKLDLKHNVVFYNRFVETEDLYSFLSATDIYITPYLNEAQITSGTLAYAVGAGAAVISTPYWHAEELLADGRGMLFPFGDSNKLAGILLDLLDHPAELATLRSRANNHGRRFIWPEIGKQYREVLTDAAGSSAQRKRSSHHSVDPLVLPTFQLTHICRLTDDTGVVQHANYIVPRRKLGYSLDDNAWALLMSLMAYKQTKDPDALRLIPVYLSFVEYMQKEDGSFWNLLSYDRRYLKARSEDTFGRVIWALGYFHRFAPNSSYQALPLRLFENARRQFRGLSSLRGVANTTIGVCHILQSDASDGSLKDELIRLIDFLVDQYRNSCRGDWKWFEPVVAYDNGILPLSLLHAFEILADQSILDIALESLDFLEKTEFPDGRLSLVGSNGWYRRGGDRAHFAQQPVNAMAMVLLFHQAFAVTRESRYLDMMFRCFLWFLGDNDLGIPLYDFNTGGCSDGLEQDRKSHNQGAESAICYFIAHLAVLFAYEDVSFYGSNASNSSSIDTVTKPDA